MVDNTSSFEQTLRCLSVIYQTSLNNRLHFVTNGNMGFKYISYVRCDCVGCLKRFEDFNDTETQHNVICIK